jgi:preprotein translocase subunit SecA
MGKRIEEIEMKELQSLSDVDFRSKVTEIFKDSRKKRIEVLGEKDSKEIEKRIFLQTIDMNWTSHIQYLEQLRQVIGLRSYGQRDPLIEYKKEAFDLFENLLNKLKIDYLRILMNLIVIDQNQNISKVKTNIINDPKCLLILRKNEKISRNERCEVTGKKFKNCCGVL